MALLPKILYVTIQIPCPPQMGAQQRTLNVGRQLQKCGQVTLVYVGPPVPPQQLEPVRAKFDHVIQSTPKFYDGPKFFERMHQKLSFHWPFHYGPRFSQSQCREFETLLKDHDIVWFHTLPAADCFSRKEIARSVMDLDDLNAEKYQLKLTYCRGPWAIMAHKMLVWKWRRRERLALDRFEALTLCSKKDKTLIGDPSHAFVVPNGFEKPAREPRYQPDRNALRLGFLGNVKYGPNLDGLRWFCARIWPTIQSRRPKVSLRIMGMLPDDLTPFQKSGIELLGFLPDVAPEIQSWTAMIVPLQYGGGTRLKIVEALSRKCPIVSTSPGAYGIEAEPGRDLLLADEPEEFANACLKLLEDQQAAANLAENGWKLFLEKYDWDQIGKTIQEIIAHFQQTSK